MGQHHFKIALAKEYGIEEAIFIDEFRFQINNNKANDRNFNDGRYWTYNSQKAYMETFPYLSIAQIKRIISSLIDKGIIMKGNYNANQYDRTNWYAFTDFGQSIVQNCYIDELKMTNGRVGNSQPIPSTIPSTNTSIYFAASGDEEADRLFSDDAASTISMLSSEKEIPHAPRNKNVTSEQVAQYFDDMWLMYERKGSKAKAKQEFAKLTEEEILTMQKHIPAYIQSRPERQYRQDFERYIKNKTFNSVVYSKTNVMLYDPDADNTSATHKETQEFSKAEESTTINGVIYR